MKKSLVFAFMFLFIFGAGCGKRQPVAIVNGVEITREALAAEVEYDIALYWEQGIAIGDEDRAAVEESALTRLIGALLLKEAASKAGITADSVDVEGRLAAIQGDYESENAFLEALEAADFTLDAYKLVLADILVIEALFEQELALSEIQVEAEDIQEMMDSYLDAYEGEQELDEEELREYVEYALEQQQIQFLRNEFVESLWQEGDIQYFN